MLRPGQSLNKRTTFCGIQSDSHENWLFTPTRTAMESGEFQTFFVVQRSGFVMRAKELADDSRIIALSSAGNPAPPRKKARYLALLHRHAEKVALSLIAAVGSGSLHLFLGFHTFDDRRDV